MKEYVKEWQDMWDQKKVQDYVEKLVESAPPFSKEQYNKLKILLREGLEEDHEQVDV